MASTRQPVNGSSFHIARGLNLRVLDAVRRRRIARCPCNLCRATLTNECARSGSRERSRRALVARSARPQIGAGRIRLFHAARISQLRNSSRTPSQWSKAPQLNVCTNSFARPYSSLWRERRLPYADSHSGDHNHQHRRDRAATDQKPADDSQAARGWRHDCEHDRRDAQRERRAPEPRVQAKAARHE